MGPWQTTRATSDQIMVAQHFSRVALRARERGDSNAASVADKALPYLRRALKMLADERQEAMATGHSAEMLDRQEADLYRIEDDLLTLLDRP